MAALSACDLGDAPKGVYRQNVCSYKQLDSAFSRAHYKATVYVQNCGATSGFVYAVNLMLKDSRFEDGYVRDPIIKMSDRTPGGLHPPLKPIMIRWDNQNQLVISYDKRAHIHEMHVIASHQPIHYEPY